MGHVSYLIRMMAYWAAGKPVESNEPPKEGFTLVFFWGRVLFSIAVLIFAFAVTCEALFRGQTTIWEGLPAIVGLVLFLVLMSAIGLLEGMQIAFFTVAKLPKSERGSSPMALRTCECLFKNGGKNLPGFMCGRQMTVTLCFFVIARVTTITTEIGGPDGDDRSYNIFGVRNWVQEMFNLGFMGALTTTILGSIAWQLVAGAFPIAFLANPIVYVFLQIALIIEMTGICSAAWFLGMLQRKAMGFQFDEIYVGTPEERSARGHADDKEVGGATMGTTAPMSNVGERDISSKYMDLVQNEYSIQREQVMGNISALREKIKENQDNAEVRKAYEFAMKLEIDTLKSVNKRQTESVRNLSLLLDGGDDDDDDANKGHAAKQLDDDDDEV